MTMGPVALTILALAVAGALASWAFGAAQCVRALGGSGARGPGVYVRAALTWPFALQRMRGSESDAAAAANKAIVAFFVCLTVAFATISLATNYNRISR